MSLALKKKVQRKFKMRGYTVKVDALDVIISFTSRFPSDHEDEALEILLDQLEMETRKWINCILSSLFSSIILNLYFIWCDWGMQDLTDMDLIGVISNNWNIVLMIFYLFEWCSSQLNLQ